MKKIFITGSIIVIIALAIIFTIAKTGNLTADIFSASVTSESFAGYAPEDLSGYTAGLGGVRGANEKCDENYDGSHWCSVDEIVSLGDDYPWTATVWVRDAVVNVYRHDHGTDIGTYTVYGGAGMVVLEKKDPEQATCDGWDSSSGAYKGPILGMDGFLWHNTCNTERPIACCY